MQHDEFAYRSIWTPRGLLYFLKNIWTPRIFIFSILSGTATFICYHLKYAIEMRVIASIFFIGIFVSFGIIMNAADERRFKAFEEIAIIKANLMAIAQIATIKPMVAEKSQRVVEILSAIFPGIFAFLREYHLQKSHDNLLAADKKINGLIELIEILRQNELPSPELSRMEQWIFQINQSFEKLIVIKEHRTPLSLRLFLQFSLGISVFILAPEFANYRIWGIILSMVVGFILISLISIQGIIEEPFRGKIDDVRLDFHDRICARFDNLLLK